MSTIVEIRVKKVRDLSTVAQIEVFRKLSEMGADFNYKGYAKVEYSQSSPIEITNVEPIEGTIIDLFKEVVERAGIPS